MTVPPPAIQRIEALMEQASTALLKRKYFEVERLSLEALTAAINSEDYATAARICLPLQEARRLKRQLAIDSGNIRAVAEPLGEQPDIAPGCYVFCPPRVGAEARQLRAYADSCEIPTIIVAREPPTRAGLCPIVAVGPITVRAFVPEPPPPSEKPARAKPGKKTLHPPADTSPFGRFVPPPMQWILAACEALGDAAIAQVNTQQEPADRADDYFVRLQSCPDHEKLHQRLMESCQQAALQPRKKRATPARDEAELEDGDDL